MGDIDKERVVSDVGDESAVEEKVMEVVECMTAELSSGGLRKRGVMVRQQGADSWAGPYFPDTPGGGGELLALLGIVEPGQFKAVRLAEGEKDADVR